MEGESPLIESTGGLDNPKETMPSDSMYWRWPSLCKISKPRVDFPEPDNPVRTTSWFLGISTSIFFRLCRRAPRIEIFADIGSPENFRRYRNNIRLCTTRFW